jgi:hypothetical protein
MLQKKYIKETEIEVLFINIEEIIVSHSLFLAKLHQGLDNFPITNIGTIFYNQIPSFFIYINFCNKFNEALDKIKELRASSKEIDYFLEQQRSHVPGFHPLQSLFIQPVQRLPRYSLLLKQFLKFTSEDHVDYEKFVLSNKKLDKILETVNEKKRRYEMNHIMTRIKQLTPEIPNLFLDESKYVCEEIGSVTFTKIVHGPQSSIVPPEEKQCLLFLFTDLLLIFEQTKMRPTSQRMSFYGTVDKFKVQYDKKIDAYIVFRDFYPIADLEVVQFKKKVIGLEHHNIETKESVRLDILLKEILGTNRISIFHDKLLELIDQSRQQQNIFHLNPTL